MIDTPDTGDMGDTDQSTERVLLLGLDTGRAIDGTDAVASISELSLLASSAGGMVIDQLLVNRDKPDSTGYFGKGKLDEIDDLIKSKDIDLAVIDDELSVRQQNHLNDRLSCRVIDRTTLILQIFADRARTREGRLQIELAQLSYMLPRLSGKGTALSRLGGGIGTRGPGESRLERDRRHIRRRIDDLKDETEQIKKQRQINRARRKKNHLPIVALVGYTNAGKSSLLNQLSDADALAEDRLFATLDPLTRRLKLDSTEVLLTDTVGFIQRIPHTLVSAFRATLEEALYADILVHVVDAAHENLGGQIRAVYKVLDEIGCKDKLIIHAFNKADLITDPMMLQPFLADYQPAVLISAKTGEGLEELKQRITELLPDPMVVRSFLLGAGDGALLNRFYSIGTVEGMQYSEQGVSGTIVLPKRQAEQYRQYMKEL